MNGIAEAALEVQEIIEQLGFEFCIIGGLAVVYWGHPRATQDIDISLQVPLGCENDDIQGIIDRQGNDLDRQQVLSELSAFCELLETDEPLSLVQQMFS